jgi:hypothetical protein
MDNPFTLSFGREPANRIDRAVQREMILESFQEERPSNQVYMITGVRGVGKTVMMTDISKYFASKDEWIVVDLTPELNLLSMLAAELYHYQGMAEACRQAKINLSFLGIGVEIDGADQITDLNVAIRRMLTHIKNQKKKVLITIDEAVCNKTMREFCSVFQIYMRQELPVFLLLSGLYEKIYELQNEETLTFLYRAPKIELQPLNIGMIANRYQKIFHLADDDALKMAQETKGYSFAFQVLGYLSWQKGEHWTRVLPEYSQYLEEYVYQKLWSEVSHKDKKILRAMAETEDTRVAAIRSTLDISSSLFSVYRNRLIKKGLVYSADYGRIEFVLPRFKEFVTKQLL